MNETAQEQEIKVGDTVAYNHSNRRIPNGSYVVLEVGEAYLTLRVFGFNDTGSKNVAVVGRAKCKLLLSSTGKESKEESNEEDGDNWVIGRVLTSRRTGHEFRVLELTISTVTLVRIDTKVAREFYRDSSFCLGLVLRNEATAAQEYSNKIMDDIVNTTSPEPCTPQYYNKPAVTAQKEHENKELPDIQEKELPVFPAAALVIYDNHKVKLGV